MLGIDLGSNTLRAVLMDENFNKIKEVEYIIGAAKDLNKSSNIGSEAILNLKNALKDLLIKGYDLKNAKVCATAAFRKAKNASEICKEIWEEFGLKIKIIDEKTEAKLSILGMKEGLRKLNISSKQKAFCDLGGGSCELSFDELFRSFEFGIITFYEKAIRNKTNSFSNHLNFSKKMLEKFKKNTLNKSRDKKFILHFLIKDKMLKKLAFLAFDEVMHAQRHLSKFKGKNIVLNSGLPTSLLSMKMKMSYENYQASRINGKKIFLQDFLNYGIKLWHMPEHKAQIWVGKNRKNYLVAGCFLFYALYNRQKFIVIDEGLREGICIAGLRNLSI
ncbi:Ppx/GppA family phosphatase [Campylobacter sp. CCS1377]|uniref:Ppx/GppA family phosphatase n=1 Tax=Campylobacter sp. CCS1377 TaxID=3158229 RepID=A0AAU7E5K6_9BACT